jgi:hypothetical protein
MMEWRIALSQDPEWAMEYIKSHSDLEPGEILPYSPRFKITEAEYYEMIACSSSVSFEKVGEDEFEIVKEGVVYRIASTLNVRDFNNIRINEEDMSLQGYFGTISKCDTIVSVDTPFGTWTGYSWREEVGDEINARVVHFNLGHVEGTSRGLITFKLRVLEDGVLTAGCDWKIFFESGVTD